MVPPRLNEPFPCIMEYASANMAAIPIVAVLSYTIVAIVHRTMHGAFGANTGFLDIP